MSADLSGAEPQRVESSFRHGTITAVGLLTAFSLGFLTAWGSNPVPWGINDLFALVPIALGVVLEVAALARLLDPRCLEIPRYMQAVRIFLAGLVLVSIGVAAALVVDFISLAEIRPVADAVD